MLRRLFSLGSALSLLLCVATMVLWVRSYWCVTVLRHVTGPPEGYLVVSMDGVLSFSEWNHFNEPRGWRLSDDSRARFPFFPDRSRFVFLGIERGGGPGHAYVSVSWAYVPAVTAALPLFWIWMIWRRKRAQKIATNSCPT